MRTPCEETDLNKSIRVPPKPNLTADYNTYFFGDDKSRKEPCIRKKHNNKDLFLPAQHAEKQILFFIAPAALAF
jgi:hypothetical protein